MLAIKKSILKNTKKMESNELKEIDIKSCTYFCFDHITKIKDLDFDNIL